MQRTQGYWMIKGDFATLESYHKEYESVFKNNPLFPAEKYTAQREKIKNQWVKNPTKGGGRSMEKELESLLISFQKIRADHSNHIEMLNLLFSRLYGYYSEILNDHARGFISGDKFTEYLECYGQAIAKNKSLDLSQWKQEMVEKIELKISEILKQN